MRRTLLSLLVLALLGATALLLYAALVENSVFSGKRPDDLGFRNGRLAACKQTPNCVSSQAERADAQHYIDPIPFKGSAAEAIAAVERALRTPERVRIIERKPDYIHAEFRSRLLGFVDDVEFAFDPAFEQPARQIHVRSASRLGKSDFGVNRARIERLRPLIAAEPGTSGKAARGGTK